MGENLLAYMPTVLCLVQTWMVHLLGVFSFWRFFLVVEGNHAALPVATLFFFSLSLF